MTKSRKTLDAFPPETVTAPNRKAPVDPLERHYTPTRDARAILAHVADARCAAVAGALRPLRAVLEGRAAPSSVLVVEPFAGAGAFMTAARELWHTELDVDGWDIDPDAPAVLDGRARVASEDVAQRALSELITRRAARLRPQRPAPNLELVIIVTNPPWSNVTTRLRNLRNQQRFWSGAGVPSVLINLQRLTSLEGARRYSELWELDPPDLIATLVRRVRWEGPGGALHPQVDKAGTTVSAWGPPPEGAATAQRGLRPPPVFGWINNRPEPRKRTAE